MTVGEAAELLKLNAQTVRAWIDAGTLPALRIGSRLRIRRSELDLVAGSLPRPRDDPNRRSHDWAVMEERSAKESPAFDSLMSRLERFRDERDWSRYHSLKDLAAGMAIEAAELKELFLWQRTEDEQALLANRKPEIEAELADVMIHCLNFASVAGIDPVAAIDRKINQNAARIPSEARNRSRGRKSGCWAAFRRREYLSGGSS